MLKQLRNKKMAKKVWIFLAVIIVPAFVLWGSGSLLRNKEESGYAGRLFGRKIPLSEFKDALIATRTQAIIQFGDKFSEAQKYLNLESQAWERLILLHEVNKRRINVTDKEVIEAIETYPFFQRNDKFDNRTYNDILQYVLRLQPRVFEEEIRQNIGIAKLYKQLTDKIKLTDGEIRQEYIKFNQEISVDYIAAIPQDFTKDISPAEQELKDYFAKNSLQFKKPISFNLDYFTLESEEQTKKIVAKINKKADLNKLAKEFSFEVKETGLFGFTDPIPGLGWSGETMNLFLKMKPGDFSPPIRTDKYYYIFRLKERKEAYIPEFDQIKDKIRETFVAERSSSMAKERIEACMKDADFSRMAKEPGIKSGSTGLFKYASYIEGIGASDSFWMTAENLKGMESSEIITMPSGFYIIRLKNRIPIDEKKFESEKAEFAKKLLQQKKQEAFNKFFEELKRKAQ